MARGSITRKYGNTTYYFLTNEVDKQTLIYQQIEKSEYDRIKNNNYQDTVNGEIESISGSQYVDTSNEKTYALIGFYDSSGNYQSTGLSLTEPQYGTVSNSVKNDSNLKKLIVSSPNTTPTNPNQQNTQGGESSTPTNPPATPPKTEKAFLVYPLDMAKTKQDRIKFTAVEYISSGNLATQQITFPEERRKNVRKGTSVFLPIQASISDQNSADWQGGNLNEMERFLVNESLKGMKNQTLEQLENQAATALGTGIKALQKYQNEGKVYLASQAVGVTDLLGRFGSVLNPNFELLFTGPQLRPFEFQFKMSAREEKEAIEIKEIIKFFKKNMAAIKDDTGIFLRAPNTFFIEYMYGGGTEPHQGINKIKECALLNCAVDYTPNGTYMTYRDGTMVSYTLSLSFQELEPIYSGDYEDKHSIGY